jgi:hypothetical protein
MKILRVMPVGMFIAWLLWFSVQARWGGVIAHNWLWALLATVTATSVIWWLTKERKGKAIAPYGSNSDITPTERLVAKEVVTWKIVTRERSIYAEPK